MSIGFEWRKTAYFSDDFVLWEIYMAWYCRAPHSTREAPHNALLGTLCGEPHDIVLSGAICGCKTDIIRL